MYIDADKLKAEIEKRQEERQDRRDSASWENEYWPESDFYTRDKEDDAILSIIASLQDEQKNIDKIKPSWHKFSEELPPYGVPVIAYHHLWVNKNFNPYGVREGFLQDNLASDSDTCKYDFCSAYWWDYHDCYTTISKIEIEGKENEYSKEILCSILPEYWTEMPIFNKN